MGCAAAVGVHDDLAAGQTGVPLGPADDKAAGGIDIVFGVLVQQLRRHGGLDHQLDHVPADLLQLRLRAVLGGDDDGVHPDGATLLVILDGDLGLAIGPEIGNQPLLADLGQALGQLVAERDGQGHQLRGLVAGVAEHHALVAGAAHLVVGAQGDVPGLLVDVGDDAAGVAVKAVLGPVVADLPHHLAGDPGNVHIAAGADLAHDVQQARGGGGLAGHTAVGVLGQDGVQHRVGDLVADLIGMSLGHRFGRKEIMTHTHILLVFVSKKISTPESGMRKKVRHQASSFVSPPDLAPYGFSQVAGLHRAVPSTTLDKVFSFTLAIIPTFFRLSRIFAKGLDRRVYTVYIVHTQYMR